MLKHSTGLRLYDVTVRLVLVVLGRFEGGSCMVSVTHFHLYGIELITTSPKPSIVFQGPSYRHVTHDVGIPESWDGRETKNYWLSWILEVCFIREDPPEVCLKHRRGSGWATPPAVQEYVAKDICTQKNVNWKRNDKNLNQLSRVWSGVPIEDWKGPGMLAKGELS